MAPVAHRGPGRPRATRSTDTRERITRAAREVFGEVGYDGATFQAVAARADLTRPAINHHFPSKWVLYQAVLAQATTDLIFPALGRARLETTLIGRLSSLIASIVQVTAVDRPLTAFLVSAVVEGQRHPELSPIEMPKLRGFLTRMVEDAVESGELSTDRDVPSLVETLAVMIWGLGLYAGFLGNPQQVEAVAANLRLLLDNNLWQLS